MSPDSVSRAEFNQLKQQNEILQQQNAKLIEQLDTLLKGKAGQKPMSHTERCKCMQGVMQHQHANPRIQRFAQMQYVNKVNKWPRPGYHTATYSRAPTAQEMYRYKQHMLRMNQVACQCRSSRHYTPCAWRQFNRKRIWSSHPAFNLARQKAVVQKETTSTRASSRPRQGITLKEWMKRPSKPTWTPEMAQARRQRVLDLHGYKSPRVDWNSLYKNRRKSYSEQQAEWDMRAKANRREIVYGGGALYRSKYERPHDSVIYRQKKAEVMKKMSEYDKFKNSKFPAVAKYARERVAIQQNRSMRQVGSAARGGRYLYAGDQLSGDLKGIRDDVEDLTEAERQWQWLEDHNIKIQGDDSLIKKSYQSFSKDRYKMSLRSVPIQLPDGTSISINLGGPHPFGYNASKAREVQQKLVEHKLVVKIFTNSYGSVTGVDVQRGLPAKDHIPDSLRARKPFESKNTTPDIINARILSNDLELPRDEAVQIKALAEILKLKGWESRYASGVNQFTIIDPTGKTRETIDIDNDPKWTQTLEDELRRFASE